MHQFSAMDLKELDYHLPQDRIAQFPSRRRDQSRLLVLRRDGGGMWHGRFRHLVQWLNPEDLVVVNDTKVIQARLWGEREKGGKIEILLCEPIADSGEALPPVEESGAFKAKTWSCLVRSAGKLRDLTNVCLDGGVVGVLVRDGSSWRISLEGVEDVGAFLRKYGHVPLPPYVARRADARDGRRYQTVFARREGAIAAPTAGLHFNKALLAKLREKGVRVESVTLQVGVGTFSPVRARVLEEHRMHSEYVEVGQKCCDAWLKARQRGGRVVAVGTTVVRALESAISQEGVLAPYRGFTDLFITPGYRFKAVDALVTNFHLPRTTLLAMVMAFAGKQPVREAYQEAVRLGYRFYSYGDAMFIC